VKSISLPNWPWIHRALRLCAAWASVLYVTVSTVQGTSWGAKDSVLATLGGVLLWIEHNAATPNVSVTTTTQDGGLTP